MELLQDLTSSRKDLEAAVRDAGSPQSGGATGTARGRWRGRGVVGGTALYDSVFLAADDVLKKQEGRKAVVLLSDGDDNGSKTSIGSAIESAQRADMLAYSINFSDASVYGDGRGPVGFGGGPGMGRGGRRGGGGAPFPQPAGGPNAADGKKVLQRIAQETGGGYFEVSKKMTLDKIYDQIEEELRSQYSLGYNPDKSGSGYHKISISVRRKNTTVRARDGYYT